MSGWAAIQLEQRYCAAVVGPALVQSPWRLAQAVFASPLIEEAAFRGIFPRSLMQRGLPPWLVWSSSLLLFVALHPSGAVTLALIVGGLCTMLAIRSGSVWPSVGLHAASNWATAAVELAGFGSPGHFMRTVLDIDCAHAGNLLIGGFAAGLVLAFYSPMYRPGGTVGR